MGTFSIRLPDSLHERLRALAERDGVSLNQFMLMAAAEKAAALEGASYLEARAARLREQADAAGKDVGDYVLELLERVPDREPQPGDEEP